MKASQFNVFFNYSGSHVGFNGFTQEYIIIEPLLYDLFDIGSRKKDFSELKEVHEGFYNFLIEQGFLVDESLDEFDAVKQLSCIVDNDNSSFQLTINPTMNCNFKCWYCYETHIKDSKMDATTIAATIKLSQNIIENQRGLRHFHISFFGGEPLLYFDKVIKEILINVSSLCKERNIIFNSGMTTNGLLIDQEMLDVCKEFGLKGFQITLDGSKEQHDKVRYISEGKGSYDKITNNIKLIARNGLYVSVRINCSSETMPALNDIMKDFNDLTPEEKKYTHFDVHKVWQVEEKIEPLMNESRAFFRENGFEVRGGIYDTVINSCYADKRNHATINYNGEVFKCTARDFVSNEKEGVLNTDGSISWNEKYEKRLNSKFKNEPCKTCRILPICGGGCTQQALEHEGVDYCVHNFDEDSKTQAVIDKFIETLS